MPGAQLCHVLREVLLSMRFRMKLFLQRVRPVTLKSTVRTAEVCRLRVLFVLFVARMIWIRHGCAGDRPSSAGRRVCGWSARPTNRTDRGHHPEKRRSAFAANWTVGGAEPICR